MDSATFEIGANWVRSPYRVLRDIEQEFDLTADQYEARSAEWDYRGAIDGPTFMARHVPREAKVLDVGCGTGLIGAALAQMGYRKLTGVDISSGMLARAEARGVYTGGLMRADLCAMPFGDASFDALVCIAVLTYAPSIERVFTEFGRVLRAGGVLVFSHRVDLEGDCGFGEALARRRSSACWRTLEVTEPRLYYPGKADYADIIMVRYHAYQVRGDSAA